MATWTVEDHLSVDLGDEVNLAQIRLVGGEVVVQTGPSCRLDLEILEGGPIEVSCAHETLRISYDEWPLAGVRGLVEGIVGSGRARGWRDWRPGNPPAVAVVLTVTPETDLDLTSVSAAVAAAGTTGELRLNTVSGDVDLSAAGRDVDVKTVSGDIYAKGLDGDVRLKSVSGAIVLGPGPSTSIDAKTVSGRVELDLPAPPGATYAVTTVSGPIHVEVPRHPSLDLEITSMSGSLESDFDLTFRRQQGRKRLRHTLGGGQARLSVTTLSGDLRIARRREAA